jgi:hypothetical protein
MQITVEIPDSLAFQAQARGLVLDRYIATLLARDLEDETGRQVTALSEVDACSPAESEEAVAERRRKAVEAMRKFSVPGRISTAGESVRAMIHEGHKY